MKYITPEEAEKFVPTPHSFQFMRMKDVAYFTFIPSKRGPGWEDVIYYLPRLKNLYKKLKGKGDSWIYILSNESQPGMYKIGYTSQEDVETRVKQLSRSTSVATPFFLEWAFKCFNAGKLEQEIQIRTAVAELEQEIHDKLRGHRISSNKEFFAISLNEARETIENLGQKYI